MAGKDFRVAECKPCRCMIYCFRAFGQGFWGIGFCLVILLTVSALPTSKVLLEGRWILGFGVGV